MDRAIIGSSLVVVLLAAVVSPAAAQPSWDPKAFAAEDTLQFLTTGKKEGEHWSTVWLAVLDGEVYIRLGTRAAERMEANVTAPYVRVRIAGLDFPSVKTEPVAGMEDRVAQAMAGKYWTDAIIRYMDHPLTLRLRPEPMPGSAAAGP